MHQNYVKFASSWVCFFSPHTYEMKLLLYGISGFSLRNLCSFSAQISVLWHLRLSISRKEKKS